MSQSAVRVSRAASAVDETRALILEAAETEFADRGFGPARLEDIAGRVGITRAAIIYHFGDKQKLYDAVLAATFRDFAARIERERALHADHPGRVLSIVESWIEYSWERPALARLFMREVADARAGFRPFVAQLVKPIFAGILADLHAGQSAGALGPTRPGHLVTILAGATTWHATSAHLLDDSAREGESAESAYQAYRADLLGVARYLLGLGGDDPGPEMEETT